MNVSVFRRARREGRLRKTQTDSDSKTRQLGHCRSICAPKDRRIPAGKK